MKKRLHDKKAGIAILVALLITSLVNLILRVTVFGEILPTIRNYGEMLIVTLVSLLLIIFTLKGKEEFICYFTMLLSAIFLVLAILFQKTSEDGLSGTIAGGTETYYGKDKSVGVDRLLRKWTLIAGIVFAVAVLAVYVFQPDYTSSMDYVDWKSLSNYSYLFKK